MTTNLIRQRVSGAGSSKKDRNAAVAVALFCCQSWPASISEWPSSVAKMVWIRHLLLQWYPHKSEVVIYYAGCVNNTSSIIVTKTQPVKSHPIFTSYGRIHPEYQATLVGSLYFNGINKMLQHLILKFRGCTLAKLERPMEKWIPLLHSFKMSPCWPIFM